MATSNRVLSSLNVAKITKGGQEVILAVATKTDLWERSDSVAKAHTTGFLKSAERSTQALPKGTAKLVMREGNHQSEGDKRDHYTAVCLDADDQYIKTEHIPAKE